MEITLGSKEKGKDCLTSKCKRDHKELFHYYALRFIFNKIMEIINKIMPLSSNQGLISRH